MRFNCQVCYLFRLDEKQDRFKAVFNLSLYLEVSLIFSVCPICCFHICINQMRYTCWPCLFGGQQLTITVYDDRGPQDKPALVSWWPSCDISIFNEQLVCRFLWFLHTTYNMNWTVNELQSQRHVNCHIKVNWLEKALVESLGCCFELHEIN